MVTKLVSLLLFFALGAAYRFFGKLNAESNVGSGKFKKFGKVVPGSPIRKYLLSVEGFNYKMTIHFSDESYYTGNISESDYEYFKSKDCAMVIAEKDFDRGLFKDAIEAHKKAEK